MKNDELYEKYLDKITTKRLGINVAILGNDELQDTTLIHELYRLNFDLVIVRLKSERIALINDLEKMFFRIKDTQLTYYYDLKACNLISLENKKESLNLREYIKTDLNAIVNIAGESFDKYGHFYVDDRIGGDICADIYKDWALRSCVEDKVADFICVAEMDNQIVGFLTFKIFNKDKFFYAAGGLGAVSKNARNLGIFTSLVKHGLLMGQKKSLCWEEHNVISANMPVNKSFFNAGFKISESYITLHGWKEDFLNIKCKEIKQNFFQYVLTHLKMWMKCFIHFLV